MTRTSFAYRPKRIGIHVHVAVFAGRDEHHRARIGELHFHADEWRDFQQEVELLAHTILPEHAPGRERETT